MPTLSWKRELSGRLSDGLIHQRAREVVRPTGAIIRGDFPSRKTGRMVQFEGELEWDAVYLFEASPLIESYGEQPTTIRYPDGARLRRYTPDFVLELTDGGQVLVEIKSIQSLQRQELQHKLAQVADFFRRQGQSFLILTDLEIRQQPRLRNLKWLFRQAPKAIPSIIKSRTAVSLLAERFPMSIRQAHDELANLGCDPFSLLMNGWLHCDLSEAVTYETSLDLGMESDHDWFCIAPRHGF